MKSTRDSDYIRIGLQYYVIGRFATLCFFSPNAGNLFHHGFEMLLKAKLLKKYSPEELHKEFSHNLPVLWSEFKDTVNRPELSKYDKLIKEFQEWEEIRYPNYPKGKNIVLKTMTGSRQKMDKNRSSKTERHYSLFLDEVDELFKNLIISWPLSPEYVKIVICQTIPEADRGIRYYEEMNNHKIW